VRGQLLVASPTLLDPNFRRAVVLVTEHGDEGAMGLVLSNPSEAPVAEAVPQLEDLVEDEAVVHVGGPVEPAAVVVLAEFDDPSESASIVFGDVGFLPADSDPSLIGAATRRARVFAGYCGWGPGQLEGELEQDAWFLEPSEEDDVFSDEPEALWSTVLRRKGGQYAVLALMPPDPSLN